MVSPVGARQGFAPAPLHPAGRAGAGASVVPGTLGREPPGPALGPVRSGVAARVPPSSGAGINRSVRSYRIAQSVSDRSRGVVQIERLDYPATTASRGRPAGEFAAPLEGILGSRHVHLYRQLLRSDGATREFLIDVDGDGLRFVEAAPEARERSNADPRALGRPVRALPSTAGRLGGPSERPVLGTPRGGQRGRRPQPPRSRS